MAKRPAHYRRVQDFVLGDRVIEGLKRRPDGRFYAAIQPTKTFGKEPGEAVAKFMLWRVKGMHPEEPAPGFMYWRKSFRYLIMYHPKVAAEVLGVDTLKDFVSLRESMHLLTDPNFSWGRIILPKPDPLYSGEDWKHLDLKS